MTRLTITVAAACCALLCAPIVRADPPTEGTPPPPIMWPTPAPIVVPSTYQGHGAEWWAQRSRRAHRDVRHLQAALRQRLPLVGGLTAAFLCIHGHEGSWTDPAPPYFGGLQMDLQFARTYGAEFLAAWGTPDHWPPFVQVTVAMRAHLSGRGFHPWPNTARACGLL